MSLRRTAVALYLAVASCTCRDGLRPIGPEELTVVPASLAFPATYVGGQRALELALSNRGGATVDLFPDVAAPFRVEPVQLKLSRGDSRALTVTFAPAAPGHFEATLRVGPLEVAVQGDGLEVPACMAPRTCHAVGFDLDAGACIERPLQNDTACSTRCVTAGSCQGGTCLGQAASCDDGDRCTVDACSEQDGCAHPPVQCPAPPTACQTARCDPQAGCVVEDVLDGTLCGPDDCLAAQVDVCLSGVCTTKPRPPSARCQNRWVPLTLPPRYVHGLSWDSVRRRVVLFGGAQSQGLTVLGDTWEWDGARWELKLPLDAPSARHGVGMVFDAARRRTVLFGGYDGNLSLSDTWEWDGTTWLRRSPPVSPPVMSWPSLAYDEARQRVVLFGRNPVTMAAETWEWNGTTWASRSPATSPSPRGAAAMAYDAARGRVVLVGGAAAGGAVLTDTWEWDGTEWLQLQPTFPAPGAQRVSIAFDPVRQKLVLLRAGDVGTPSLTYEWTSAGWAQRTTVASPPARQFPALVWDGASGQVLAVAGLSPLGLLLADTWRFDGTTWALAARTDGPAPRTGQSMAYDAARSRLVLFSGQVSDSSHARISDTWEWADAGWSRAMPPVSPPHTYGAAMAFDVARARTVLAAGSDTWEWDGAAWTRFDAGGPFGACDWDTDAGRVVGLGVTDAGVTAFEWAGSAWLRRSTGQGPSPRGAYAAAYDSARQRLVFFGGRGSTTGFGDTWELDGTTWILRSPATSPSARSHHAMAYDPVRRRVVLHGGYTGFTSLGDTWEWDGNDWALKPVVSAPPDQFSASMVWDPSLQKVVYFGASLFVLLP